MNYRVFGFSFFAVVLAFGSVSVHAAQMQTQAKVSYCEDVKSTADTIACAKKRHDSAQADLKTTYQRAIESFGMQTSEQEVGADVPAVGPVERLKKSQKDWLSYRDGECQRQVDQEPNQSLKLLREKDCFSRLTEQRTAVLKADIKARKNQALGRDAPRDLQNVPVWMNVLAGAYDDVFWRYGSRLRADLNCDGQDEILISGVQRVRDSKSNQRFSPVLVVSDHPQTGRPQSRLISFHMDSEHQIPVQCNDGYLSFKLMAHEAEESLDENESVCGVVAMVMHERSKECGSYLLSWDGKDYQLNSVAADNEAPADAVGE